MLIVDDDVAIRQMLTDVLQDAGYQARSCSCGIDALAEIRTWQPNVVLLDVLMLPMDGFSVLREMRQQGLVPRLPVILLSAYLARRDPAGLTQQIQGLGARAYLTKPFTRLDDLLRLIEHPPDALWQGGGEP